MLAHTFCHLPSITVATESKLWAAGIVTWADLSTAAADRWPARRAEVIRRALDESTTQLAAGNAAYFATALPSKEHWRLFRELRERAAYLDIETTGLSPDYDKVTTVVTFDGQRLRHYIQGKSLGSLANDLTQHDILITFNGKTFDLPFLHKTLGVAQPRAHIDVRYVLGSLGIKGGLKNCERQLGLHRGALDGVDGYAAVLLWREHQRCIPTALDTLLAYNAQDVINLEVLMVAAYNKKVEATPFAKQLTLPTPTAVVNPFKPDETLLRRLVLSW